MIKEEVFKVTNMKCSGCSDTVTNTLESLNGVKAVDVDLGSKEVKVSIDPSKVSKTDIDSALEQKGYPIS